MKREELLDATYDALEAVGPVAVAQLRSAVGNGASFGDVISALSELEERGDAVPDRNHVPVLWSTSGHAEERRAAEAAAELAPFLPPEWPGTDDEDWHRPER